MRLNVCIVASEKLFSASDREVFQRVGELVAFIVPRAGVTFGVLIRENGSAGFQNVERGVAFGRDHFQRRSFHFRLTLDKLVNFGIVCFQMRVSFNGHEAQTFLLLLRRPYC